MAKISTYATVAPTSTDKVIGTDTDNSSATKNFTIQGIADFAATLGVGGYNAIITTDPTSTPVAGEYVFIGVDTHVCTLPTAGGATVSVDTTAGQTINGAATQPLATQFTSYTFISDGTNWFIAN